MKSRELALSVYRPPASRSPWELKDFAVHDRLRLFSLGRWALVEALRLASARGKKVLLPNFICREVLASLRAAGAEAAYYPVNPSLGLAVDPENLPPAAAILAVDYFGFPQDMEPFEEYCRNSGAVLIEDNAHGLFSRDVLGRPLGTRAHLGILSPRKTLQIPNGGALLVNDAALWPQTQEQLRCADGISESSTHGFLERRRLARAFAPLFGARFMTEVISRTRAVRRDPAARDKTDARSASEALFPLEPEPCLGLLTITCADPETEKIRRRELYALCEDTLRPAGIKPLFPNLPAGTVPYGYPFRATSETLTRATALLRRNGLLCDYWPDLPTAVASLAPDYLSNIFLAHFLW